MPGHTGPRRRGDARLYADMLHADTLYLDTAVARHHAAANRPPSR